MKSLAKITDFIVREMSSRVPIIRPLVFIGEYHFFFSEFCTAYIDHRVRMEGKVYMTRQINWHFCERFYIFIGNDVNFRKRMLVSQTYILYWERKMLPYVGIPSGAVRYQCSRLKKRLRPRVNHLKNFVLRLLNVSGSDEAVKEKFSFAITASAGSFVTKSLFSSSLPYFSLIIL